MVSATHCHQHLGWILAHHFLGRCVLAWYRRSAFLEGRINLRAQHRLRLAGCEIDDDGEHFEHLNSPRRPGLRPATPFAPWIAWGADHASAACPSTPLRDEGGEPQALVKGHWRWSGFARLLVIR